MILPPLTHLRAFEAAARHQSFLRAAEELGMTAAAVSQHVRSLEDWLGLSLFDRLPRGVRLTGAGRDFGDTCHRALTDLAQAVERVRFPKHPQQVALACQPSIVSLWLARRLPAFRAAYPDIQVSIVYPMGARTPEEAGTDLLIRHGPRPERAAEAILSAATRPTAAASLGLTPCTPEALLTADLLHDATEEAWRRWFAGAGQGMPRGTGPIFADFSLLVSSVLAGSGVGLCPTALIADDLRSGTLIQLSDHATDTDLAYWLLGRPAPTDAAEAFRHWLVEQAMQTSTA